MPPFSGRGPRGPAERACIPSHLLTGPYGRLEPSLVRLRHLYAGKDWAADFRIHRKMVVVLCRYMRQPLDLVLDLPMSELALWVHMTSDAIGKENSVTSRED